MSHLEDAARDLLDTEPEPLRRPLPKPQPYPVEALGPVLSGAVEAICSTIKCPPAVAAGSVLMMGSLATQGLADVRQDGLLKPASLFLLTVAQSGERKSASDKVALTPLDNWLKTSRKDHRDKAEKHAAELKEHAARVAAIDKRCKDGEGLADALRGVGRAPPAPRSPSRTIADTTQEGIFKALLHGHQSQALASAEAGIVTSGHSMKPEAVARWIGSLSLLWDGAPLDRIRQDGGRQELYGRRLCSHLMMQPPIAEQLLGDELMIGQGILARFLICWPESTVGTRTYVPRSPLADPRMQRYCDRLAELLALPLLNVCHFAKLGTAARPGLKVWLKALAAATRSGSGRGLASAPAGQGHLVAVARRGRWSRLLTIEQKVDSLALVGHLLRLEKSCGDLAPRKGPRCRSPAGNRAHPTTS